MSRDGNRIPQGREQLLSWRIPEVAFGHHSRVSPVAPPPQQNVHPDTIKVVRSILGQKMNTNKVFGEIIILPSELFLGELPLTHQKHFLRGAAF